MLQSFDMSPSGETEVLETKKRTPRKRTPKVIDDAEKAPVKRAPRKRVETIAEVEEKPKRARKKDIEIETPTRKAPTPIASEKLAKKSSRKHLIVVAFLLLLGIGSSAAVGLTDKGQINVVYMIDERNKKAAERGEQPISAAPEQLIDGGLIPADNQNPDPTSTPAPAATSTASSSAGQIPLTNEEAAAAMGAATASSTQ